MPLRTLRAEELAEIDQVFGPGLDITRVRVNEGSPLPNFIGRVGATLRGAKPPENNAITLMNTAYFPVILVTDRPQHPNWLRDMAWLMHELTHAWQYQHAGIIYLYQAVFKSPTYVYAPAGETVDGALKKFTQDGKNFLDFNREQQGDIVRDYYFYLKQNADVTAWEPYLKAVRLPPPK